MAAAAAGVNTVDPRETAKFEADAALWWDEEHGPFAPLHSMNPVRCGFIRDVLVRHFDNFDGGSVGDGTTAGLTMKTRTAVATTDGVGGGGVGFGDDGLGGSSASPPAAPAALAASGGRLLTGSRHAAQPLAGLRLLDVGCGGGILCEALARMGADVTGIDAAPGNIVIATAHAALDPDVIARRVTYHATTAEALLAAGASFDAVLSLEVVEHVNDPAGFVACLAGLTRPGGAVVMSTLSRTARSYALAILAAERVLSWVPPGTHDFGKFLTPEELAVLMARGGLELREAAGMRYTPPPPLPQLLPGARGMATGGRWSLSDDTAVNYICYATKESTEPVIKQRIDL